MVAAPAVALTGVMHTPNEQSSHSSYRHTGASFFDSIRRSGVVRSQDRWAGGVAGGLARRFAIDPAILRGIFVVLTLFSGLGLLIYGLCWALLPEETDGRIHLEQAIVGRFDAALAVAAVAVIIGLAQPGLWFAPFAGSGAWGVLISIVTVGAVIAVVAIIRSSGTAPDHPVAQPQEPATPPPPTGAPASMPAHTPAPGPAAGDQTGPISADSTMPLHTDHHDRTRAGDGQFAPAHSTSQPSPPAPTPPLWSAQAPAAAAPPRRRSPGPGYRLVLAGLAGIFFVLAAVVITWFEGYFSILMPPLVIVGGVLVFLGIVITVAGFLGRRGGWLSFFAILALAVGAGMAIASFDPYGAQVLNWDTEPAVTSADPAHQGSDSSTEDESRSWIPRPQPGVAADPGRSWAPGEWSFSAPGGLEPASH